MAGTLSCEGKADPAAPTQLSSFSPFGDRLAEKAHNGAVIRFVFAVGVLTLLVAPPSACGGDVVQPVPMNGQCSVPADRHWTPQEKFVWQHVCIGEVANFNIEPGYGGNLDPKGPKGLPDSRILRPSFVEAILLAEKYRHALTRRGLGIVGARFTEPVDLEDTQLGHDFALYQCLIEKGARFGRLRSTHTIELGGSKIIGTLDMAGARIDQSVLVRDTAEVGPIVLEGAYIGGQLDLSSTKVTIPHAVEVALSGVHVGGQLALIGSKITGTLTMHGLQVEKDLLMNNGAEFGNNVDLTGAQVSGQLRVEGSTVTGTVDMEEARIDRTLFADNAKFGRLDLIGAHVGGELRLVGSKVAMLRMQGVQVSGDLLMGYGSDLGDVDLSGGRVGGQLSLSGSKVQSTIEMGDVQVGSTVYLGHGAEFDGPINFYFAKVGENVELADGSFHKGVNITGTQIGGELRLGSSHHNPARWSPNVTLVLRDVSASSIQDLSNSWPDKLDLNGFTYRSLGGLFASEKDPMIDRPAGWFQAWLRKQQPYTPAPYEQLATVLRDEGKPEVADDILYSAKQIERAQSTGMRHVELTADKWFIGYGYHKFWSVYWAFGFLLAGTALLWLSGEGRRLSRHYNLLYGIFYSFDLLLPIIRLREKHYKVDLRGWVRYYFYVHRTMGYVLASFLIAGISGLTK